MNFTSIMCLFLCFSCGVKSSVLEVEASSSDLIVSSLTVESYFDENRVVVEGFVKNYLPTFIKLSGEETQLPYFISLYIQEGGDPRVALQDKENQVPFSLDHMEDNGAGLIAVCTFKQYTFNLQFSMNSEAF